MHVMPAVALAKGERSDTPTSTASSVAASGGCESNSTSGAGVGTTPAEPKPSRLVKDTRRTSEANPDVQVRDSAAVL